MSAKNGPRDLQGNPLPPYVCVLCRNNVCEKCVDVVRMIYKMPATCNCRRPGHGGEPRDKQILDPETGTVHAPGLTVTEEGEVRFDDAPEVRRGEVPRE